MNILGISNGHDAGAAIICNGQVIFAANEERFNRVKMYCGFPIKTLDYILNNVLPAEKIDLIVFERKVFVGTPGYDLSEFDLQYFLWDIANYINLARFIGGSDIIVKNLFRFLEKTWSSYNKDVRKILKEFKLNTSVKLVDHHFSHASGAYYSSGFNDGLMVTIDGSGDGYCSKVFKGTGGKLTEIFRIPMYHSIANYYSYITKILGFTPGKHEGKVTGLAGYGKFDEDIFNTLRKRVIFDKSKGMFVNKGFTYNRELKYLSKVLAKFKHQDIAFAIQSLIEEMAYKYVDAVINRVFEKEGKNVNLAVSGGLFSNVKLNQKIAGHAKVDKFFVYPNMGDGGNSTGAALGYYYNFISENNYKPCEIETIYTGPEYSGIDMKTAILRSGYKFRYLENMEEKIAKLLAKGNIVARFNGRMEYGPRALGNRSILYHTADKSVNDWLNKKLGRNEFMPFAPVVQFEDSTRYFNDYSEKTYLTSKFMTITYSTAELFIKEAPAANHVDNTARPQVIHERDNKSYYDILTHYKRLTGRATLINTSFNMHEEPIVMTPEDALRAFSASNISTLAMGNYLVENRD